MGGKKTTKENILVCIQSEIMLIIFGILSPVSSGGVGRPPIINKQFSYTSKGPEYWTHSHTICPKLRAQYSPLPQSQASRSKHLPVLPSYWQQAIVFQGALLRFRSSQKPQLLPVLLALPPLFPDTLLKFVRNSTTELKKLSLTRFINYKGHESYVREIHRVM